VCALTGTEHEPPYDFDEAYRRHVWTAHHWQHWLARGNFPDPPYRAYLERSALPLKGPGQLPAPSVPGVPGAQRARVEGPDVRADRGARGRRDDVPAGDAGRRAQ